MRTDKGRRTTERGRADERARPATLSLLVAAVALGAGLLACDNKTSAPPIGSTAPASGVPRSGPPNASGAAASPGQPNGSARPGLATGLAGLASYHATYRHTVDGTLDGQPYATIEQVERLVVAQPADKAGEDSLMQATLPGGAASYLRFVRLGDSAYLQVAPNAGCQGMAADQVAGTIGEPAAALPVPDGASKVGTETVNGIAATHYRLDGVSLHLAAGTAAGDLWLADTGGFVVRYALEIQPPSPATGKGLEAHQTISYELTEVGQVAPIVRPAGCSPVLTSIPVPPDAVEVRRRSAFLTFSTPSNPTAVAQFYADALPKLGWKANPSSGQAPEAGLGYSKGESSLQVMLEATDGGWQVSVLLFDPADTRPVGSAAPSASPGASTAPSTSAAPGASVAPSPSAESTRTPATSPSIDPTSLGSRRACLSTPARARSCRWAGWA